MALPAMRTESWERWGTFPLRWDPLSPPSLCLGTSLLGLFMGKKSLETPSPFLLGTAPHISLRDQRRQLSHDLPRILLLKKVLGVSLSSPAPHPQVSQAPTSGPGETQLLLVPARGLGCDFSPRYDGPQKARDSRLSP